MTPQLADRLFYVPTATEDSVGADVYPSWPGTSPRGLAPFRTPTATLPCPTLQEWAEFAARQAENSNCERRRHLLQSTGMAVARVLRDRRSVLWGGEAAPVGSTTCAFLFLFLSVEWAHTLSRKGDRLQLITCRARRDHGRRHTLAIECQSTGPTPPSVRGMALAQPTLSSPSRRRRQHGTRTCARRPLSSVSVARPSLRRPTSGHRRHIRISTRHCSASRWTPCTTC